MTWQSILFILLGGAFAWLSYRQIKSMPSELLSKNSIMKSLEVLGILGIGLILLIWILVFFLKS